MNTILTFNSISKIYGTGENCVKALSNINLIVDQGEMLAITGASGSGKTTLLNIIGCMDKPTDGEYLINGEAVSELSAKSLSRLRNQKFGFVMQDYALIDYYSVYKNIELPLIYGHVRKRKPIAEKMAGRLGIEDKLDRQVRTLSGGQKQRVAIARALVNQPDIILADEPTGALDSQNGNQVIDILEELNQEGKTVIIVTHNPEIASRCSRNIRLADGLVL